MSTDRKHVIAVRDFVLRGLLGLVGVIYKLIAVFGTNEYAISVQRCCFVATIYDRAKH